MVEYSTQLNGVFGALSDPTRRDILHKLSKQPMSVGEIAQHYDLTFAAVAKHVHVLTQAGLVTKQRQGKEQLVSVSPAALAQAFNYLESYQALWESRLDKLATHLKTINKSTRSGTRR